MVSLPKIVKVVTKCYKNLRSLGSDHSKLKVRQADDILYYLHA